MNIAYVSIGGRGLIDDCVADMVEHLQAAGLRVAGTVRAQAVADGAHRCDMDIRVLPDGPLFRISQPLGKASAGCRLDGGAIEGAAFEVEARVDGADVLVVNKFGKQEALGRGLCGALARAIERDIPVLVGVNGLNLADFLRFTDGTAVRLDPTPDAALEWIEGTRASRAALVR
jgi:nucleoside-triphosphatase THEP1